MANYMFEVTVSNSPRNQTQNVAGYFGTGTAEAFVGAVCEAGTLCVQLNLTNSLGYEQFGIKNGNTWNFLAATNGSAVAARASGDHTGIYAFNNYDVNKATSGDNAWNLGANTLGLSLPSGERGDFTELIVGEQYTWGADNFSAPVSTNAYATISNGKWVPTATAPTDGSVYAEILRTKPVNEGTTYWGVGYVLRICRSAVSA